MGLTYIDDGPHDYEAIDFAALLAKLRAESERVGPTMTEVVMRQEEEWLREHPEAAREIAKEVSSTWP